MARLAGGGDGTIKAVVNALVGKGKKPPRVTMGILRLGTANDFAHGLGLLRHWNLRPVLLVDLGVDLLEDVAVHHATVEHHL